VAPARAAQGDVPNLLTQTGRLLDAGDQPVTGSVTMVFSLYAAPTGGAAVWTESHEVTLDDGYFVLTLGTTTALPAFDGSPAYLGIRVGADPEMTPREELVSVPYAMFAGDVIGDIHPASVIVNGITVINNLGQWVGDATGLVGPAGPEVHAVSRTMAACLDASLAQGHAVTFVPMNGLALAGYTEGLEDRGIECPVTPWRPRLESWLALHGREVDRVFLSRPQESFMRPFHVHVAAAMHAAITFA